MLGLRLVAQRTHNQDADAGTGIHHEPVSISDSLALAVFFPGSLVFVRSLLLNPPVVSRWQRSAGGKAVYETSAAAN